MKILYIFPHPDDESFGPAGAIYRQVKQGHEIFLLTLTRGGATKVRHQLGLSIEEMGRVRYLEMLKVKEVLGIHQMEVLDYEDGGLAYVNPLDLENLVAEYLAKWQPHIVVTYPLHGGSGHHDHIALHAAVNRVYHHQQLQSTFLKRLAFFTLPDTGKPMFIQEGLPRVTWTPPAKIGITVQLTDEDVDAMKRALLCYETYQQMVQTTQVIEHIGRKVHFQLAGVFPPVPYADITEGL